MKKIKEKLLAKIPACKYFIDFNWICFALITTLTHIHTQKAGRALPVACFFKIS